MPAYAFVLVVLIIVVSALSFAHRRRYEPKWRFAYLPTEVHVGAPQSPVKKTIWLRLYRCEYEWNSMPDRIQIFYWDWVKA